ncbi:hypothetical protein CDL12_14547 [Handroanthus impetiginosus]|uniref:Uncharacterized protein n=1 Tax=Handroanthus impetiginosus TaxID=429701 RepID=A0A2G9H5P3_9LAMI|nr:hypothetical protein CDL12_14547 [Handroanthus impetiginosus]
MAKEKILRELAAPDLTQKPLCIEYPDLDVPFELKFVDAMVNKTPSKARNLISLMVTNSQQFGFVDDFLTRVNEVKSLSLEYQISNLTSFVQQLVAKKVHQVKAYGIYGSISHPTNMYPTLQEDPYEHTNTVRGFLGPPQRKYDPYSNTENPRWRDYPNLSYGARPPNFQHFRPGPLISPPHSSSESNKSKHPRDEGEYQILEKQVSQLANLLSRFESQGKLPSQTIVNPKQNVCTIILRNDKELKKPIDVVHKITLEEETEKEVVPKPLVIEPYFPERFTKSKKEKKEKENF